MSTEQVQAVIDWIGPCFMEMDNGYRHRPDAPEVVGGWHCRIVMCDRQGEHSSPDWATAIIEAAKKAGWKPEVNP